MSVLTNLLASKNYISTNKVLSRAIGLYEAIVFAELCSKHNFYKENGKLDNEGYFFMTAVDIQHETTLTTRQQAPVLEHLEELGFITIKLKGVPAKKHFSISEENEINFIRKFNYYLSSFDKMSNPVSTKCRNKDLQNVETSSDKMLEQASTKCLTNKNNNKLKDNNNNKSLSSPTVEAPEEKELLVDLQTKSELDTPLRPAPSFESQTKPIEVTEPKEAKTDEAIKALKVGDRSKHLHQHFIDAFSNTYKTLSDGDAFLWQGKELIAIKKVREELTNLLYTKYEKVSDEKIKDAFTTFMASALKDKWMKDNFSPSMLFSKFSAVIILVKKHANGSRPSSMPVYTAKTVAFTSFT